MSNKYSQYQNDYMARILELSANNGNDTEIKELQRERDKKLYGLYGDDFQAEIDRRSAENPNDPVIADLNRLRREKVYNDPWLMQKYGDTIYPNQSMIQKTYENNREMAVENLRNSIKEALSDIRLSREKTLDEYIGVPQKIRAESDAFMRQSSENLARMGLSSSGLSETARLRAAAELQNSLLRAELSKNAQLAAYDNQEAQLRQKAALEENSIIRDYENELLQALREDKALMDQQYDARLAEAYERNRDTERFKLDLEKWKESKETADLEQAAKALNYQIGQLEYELAKDPESIQNQKALEQLYTERARREQLQSQTAKNIAQANKAYTQSKTKSSSSTEKEEKSQKEQKTDPDTEAARSAKEIADIIQRYLITNNKEEAAAAIFYSDIIPNSMKWILAENYGLVEAMPYGPLPADFTD